MPPSECSLLLLSVDKPLLPIFLEAQQRKRARSIILLKSTGQQEKKQGAAGITTAAPYITGQWGRGDNRLPE